MADAKYLTIPRLDRRQIARIFWRIEADPETGCWNWLGPVQNGYGQFFINGKQELAHRALYAWLVEPIERGLGNNRLQLDHACNTPTCVNPAHMKLTTARENILRSSSPPAQYARRTHCKNGHEFTPENTIISTVKAGRYKLRKCRTCYHEYHAAYRKKSREAAKTAKPQRKTPRGYQRSTVRDLMASRGPA